MHLLPQPLASDRLFSLQTYGSLQDVLVSFGRRVLCYPLYRHFDMVSAAVRDAATILQSGELQTACVSRLACAVEGVEWGCCSAAPLGFKKKRKIGKIAPAQQVPPLGWQQTH